MLHAAVLSVLALSVAGFQEPAPADVSAVASAGLAPGALPDDVTPEARAAWTALERALAPRGGGAAVRAFDLTFEGRAWASHVQSNDFDGARYRFLAPDWVRTTLRSGREQLRGPQGDFLLDGREVVPLIGRDHKEDRKQLDQTVGVARNFCALTDASRLRVASLVRLEGPPATVPEPLREAAARLVWLELTSPDFRVWREGAPIPSDALFRVQLGLDPAEAPVGDHTATHLPRLVTIAEDVEPAARAESAMLLELTQFRELDGFRVPHELRVHPPVPEQDPWRFRDRPSLELWLLPDGRLRPELSVRDFQVALGSER